MLWKTTKVFIFEELQILKRSRLMNRAKAKFLIHRGMMSWRTQVTSKTIA